MRNVWWIAGWIALASCGGSASPPTPPTTPAPPPPKPAARIDTAEIALTIPDGYRDITASMKAQIPYVVAALEQRTGSSSSVIVLQKAQVRTGAIDSAECAERGRAIVEDGPQIPGKPATLNDTAAVSWSGGTGCQYDYVTPDGIVTRMVEFHDGKPDIWVLICQPDTTAASPLAGCDTVRQSFTKK